MLFGRVFQEAEAETTRTTAQNRISERLEQIRAGKAIVIGNVQSRPVIQRLNRRYAAFLEGKTLDLGVFPSKKVKVTAEVVPLASLSRPGLTRGEVRGLVEREKTVRDTVVEVRDIPFLLKSPVSPARQPVNLAEFKGAAQLRAEGFYVRRIIGVEDV